MSEYPPEVTTEDNPGFRSALFLNMSEYKSNCMTPKKREIRESMDSIKLSIESLTPGTTPKGKDKRKNDSNFNFCLSKDLLQRLEENSPYTVYAESERKESSDIYLGNEFDENQKKEENENDNYSLLKYKLMIEANKNEEANLKLSDNLDKNNDAITNEKENEDSNELNNKNSNKNDVYYPNSFNLTSSNNMGVFTGFGKNIPHYGNLNQLYYFNSRNAAFNKFNFPFMNNTYGSNNSYNGNGNLIVNNNKEQGNNNLNVNMYGKTGWICCFCKNFNYEIRNKCNRCSNSRNELINLNNSNAVIINTNNVSFNKSTENKEVSVTNSNLGTNTGVGSGKKKKPFIERAGDWNCYKCKNLNFSFRVMCNRCQLSKKESEKMSQFHSKNGINNDNVNPNISSESSDDNNSFVNSVN